MNPAGARAERRARLHYRLRGYRILETNAWAGGHELDVVARRGRQLVFCEVKAKLGEAYGDPAEMVDAEKRRRLRRAAEAWLARNPECGGLEVRFEVVALRGGGSSVSLTPSEFERHYLAREEATAQSGCNSGEEGWEIGRRPIAAAIHRPGSFLDVGCANGLLMASVVEWSEHEVEPYGLDFAPGLVDLARTRLPQWADRIFLGDALEWTPPRRFDFVRTELVYAPTERRRELVDRLLGWLEPDGRLIVCGYGDPVRAELRSWGFEPELELEWRSATGRLNELAALGCVP